MYIWTEMNLYPFEGSTSRLYSQIVIRANTLCTRRDSLFQYRFYDSYSGRAPYPISLTRDGGT